MRIFLFSLLTCFLSCFSFAQTHSDLSGNDLTASEKGYVFEFNGNLSNSCGPAFTDWFQDGYNWFVDGGIAGVRKPEELDGVSYWVHVLMATGDCNRHGATLDLSGGFSIRASIKASEAAPLFVTANTTVGQLYIASDNKTQTITSDGFNVYTWTFADTVDWGGIPENLGFQYIDGISFSLRHSVEYEFEWIEIGDAVGQHVVEVSGVQELNPGAGIDINQHSPGVELILKNELSESGMITITNLEGVEQGSFELKAGNSRNYSLEGLIGGVYVARFLSKGYVYSQKFIVND